MALYQIICGRKLNKCNKNMLKLIFGGSHVDGGVGVTSWLVRSTMDQVVQVRALAGDIVLCSWTRPFTL